MASTRTGYLAVIMEDVKAVAKKPINFLPFKDGQIAYNQEIIQNNPIKGNRWNAQESVPGKVNTDGSFNFDMDAKTIGYFFLIGLGGYSKSTLEAGVYEHIFTVANDLPSLSLEQLKGNPDGVDHELTRAFGVMLDTLEISASDGIVNYTPNLKAHGLFQKADLEDDVVAGSAIVMPVDKTEGLIGTDNLTITDKGQAVTEDIAATAITKTSITGDIVNSYAASDEVKFQLTPQTPSYDCENTVYSFHNVNFKFGLDLAAAALAAEENVENWTLDFNNQLEERFGSLRESPSVIAPKGAMGNVKFTKFFTTLEERDDRLNQTRKATIITLDLGKKIGVSTTHNYTVKIELNDLRYSTRNMENGTDELLVTEIEAPIYYNCTDGQAMKITVTNDKEDYEV